MTRSGLVAVALGLAVGLAGSGQAHAGSITYVGTFNATFSDPQEGIPANFSGSFTFQFDLSTVPGTGFSPFFVPVDSLSLTPSTIGLITFTTSNTQVELLFVNGQLDYARFQWEAGAVLGEDSFEVEFRGPALGSAEFNRAEVNVATGGTGSTRIGTGSITAVPEPSALALLGTGALTLAACSLRRRRHAA